MNLSLQRYAAPVLAVCGFSGSGKTTLLEAAIPHLVAKGLAIAVIKHDAHGVVVDTPGKDSDRLFRAGATVALRGPDQQFERRNGAGSLSLDATVADLARDHDLVLIEGHKDTPLPKFWLEDAVSSPAPGSVSGVIASLSWDSNRLQSFLAYIQDWLPKEWRQRLLLGGMLVGGRSSRMGSPKQLVSFGNSTLGEIVLTALQSATAGVVALGAGPLPAHRENLSQLPDALGFAGPFAGLLSAHRWAPHAAWVVAACDHPWLRASDIEWLISLRQPGVWAIIPRQEDGHPCPTLALYEPQALTALERRAVENPERYGRMFTLIEHPRTLVVDPPPEIARAWKNLNTPDELRTAELSQ